MEFVTFREPLIKKKLFIYNFIKLYLFKANEAVQLLQSTYVTTEKCWSEGHEN